MKSLACFVTGIALIALVVPSAHIQYVMAQSGTKAKHWCEKIPVSNPVMPVNVFCDRNKNDCNERYRRFYEDIQRCVGRGDELTSNCNYWQGASYQQYTIKNNGVSTYHAEIVRVSAAGVVGCTLWGTVATLYTGGNIFAGIAVSIVCGGVVTHHSLTLNICDFGTCSVDYTIPSVSGPNHMRRS